MRERPNVNVETHMINSPNWVEVLKAEVGVEHLIYGSNAPLAYVSAATAQIEYADVAEVDKTLIFDGNQRRLGVDHFDLYQIHAITTMDELDAVTRAGGALEAFVEARSAGLVRHLGITGHGIQTPAVFLEALRRFDFDSVLFPINFVQFTQ